MAAIPTSHTAAAHDAVVAWLPPHRFAEFEASNVRYFAASPNSFGAFRDLLTRSEPGIVLIDPEDLDEQHEAARQIVSNGGWLVVFHMRSSRTASLAVLQWLHWGPAAILRGRARVDHDSIREIAAQSASRIQLLQLIRPQLASLSGPIAGAAIDVCLGLASAGSVEELARGAGVAPRSLQRHFREAGLESPTLFVHAIGVTQLLHDLLEESGSIESVAAASSLRHRRVLSRWTKRILGVTPSDVRDGRMSRRELLNRIADRLTR
jgi:AraC-like DNA-binding protein